MQTKFKPKNPDEIEMELTVSMTLKDWKALKQQLGTRFPSWKLNDTIYDMISKAEKHFYPERHCLL